MVVYTDEEVIEKCNEAEALGAARAAKDRDRAMVENTALRRKINNCRDALRSVVRKGGDGRWYTSQRGDTDVTHWVSRILDGEFDLPADLHGEPELDDDGE